MGYNHQKGTWIEIRGVRPDIKIGFKTDMDEFYPALLKLHFFKVCILG